MNTQYNVAIDLVEDYWDNSLCFWDWIAEGPAHEAESEAKTAEEYVDYLDQSITSIIQGDPECYTSEEREYLNDCEYEIVKLKHNYEFLSALYDRMKDFAKPNLVKGVAKMLFLAKLKEA